jgi:hypothetical protein
VAVTIEVKKKTGPSLALPCPTASEHTHPAQSKNAQNKEGESSLSNLRHPMLFSVCRLIHKGNTYKLRSPNQSQGRRIKVSIMKRVFHSILTVLLGAMPFVASADPEDMDLVKHHHHHHLSDPPVVPEVNVGLVLIPIAFAILLLASRQLFFKRGIR